MSDADTESALAAILDMAPSVDRERVQKVLEELEEESYNQGCADTARIPLTEAQVETLRARLSYVLHGGNWDVELNHDVDAARQNYRAGFENAMRTLGITP